MDRRCTTASSRPADTLELSGKPPYRLVIGNASHLEVVYEGRDSGSCAAHAYQQHRQAATASSRGLTVTEQFMTNHAQPMPAGPSLRRTSRQVIVRSGGRRVLIGGGAPVVVQSMTNTDTAEAIKTADSGQGAGAGRLRDRPDHRQLRRGGRRSAGDPRATRPDGRRRPSRRRLSLQRPQAADRLPGMRRGAFQIPDQSRQRRHQRPPRRQLQADDRRRLPLRQAGADRRQLGLARSGAAGAADGS